MKHDTAPIDVPSEAADPAAPVDWKGVPVPLTLADQRMWEDVKPETAGCDSDEALLQDLFTMLLHGYDARVLRPQPEPYDTHENTLRAIAAGLAWREAAVVCEGDAWTSAVVAVELLGQLPSDQRELLKRRHVNKDGTPSSETFRWEHVKGAGLHTARRVDLANNIAEQLALGVEPNQLRDAFRRLGLPTPPGGFLDAQEVMVRLIHHMQRQDLHPVSGGAAQPVPADTQDYTSLAGVMRERVSAALDAGLEQVANGKAVLALVGVSGSEVGTPQLSDVAGQRAAKALLRNQKLASVMRLFGNMRLSFKQKAGVRTKRGRAELTGVTLGDAVEHQLPTETLYMATPALQGVWAAKYAARQLLQHEFDSPLPKDKGPIVFLLDSSGSMDSCFGGSTREAWSKALVLTWLEIARKEKRDVCVLVYSSTNQQRWFEFPHARRADTAGLLADMVNLFYTGGTQTEQAMVYAIKQIKERPKMAKADLVLVTDAEPLSWSTTPDKWQAALKHQNCVLYTVMLPNGGGTDKTLAAISEKVIDVRTLVDKNAASEAVAVALDLDA